MDLLARREHARLELEQKLSKREYDDAEIKQTLDRLEQDGLLSNERFTEQYTRMRINKGFGPLKIAAELRARGVADNMANAALMEYHDVWLELAKTQQQKKFQDLPEDFSDRARQMRFLQGRGFSNEHIRQVFN